MLRMSVGVFGCRFHRNMTSTARENCSEKEANLFLADEIENY